MIRQCFDAGAAGAIVKALTDIKGMARLTENSKYCVMDNKGNVIRGKMPRDFVFYGRSGYPSTYYKEWIPHMKEPQKYANDRDAHMIGSVGAKDLDGWRDFPMAMGILHRSERQIHEEAAGASSGESAPQKDGFAVIDDAIRSKRTWNVQPS